MQKTSIFWEFCAKKVNFGQFLTKMGITGNLSKKPLGTFLSGLQALTNYKVPEKNNERISRNCVTDKRDSLSLKRLGRETKKFDKRYFEHLRLKMTYIFGQNQANLRMTRNRKLQLQL